MQTIKIAKNQTLLDIAVKHYGDVNGVFWLVEDNDLDGIVDPLQEGRQLLLRDQPLNLRIVERLKPYLIATAENARGEGIGFWYIEKDFIVS